MNNQVIDISEVAAKKKAGLVSIAMTIVCQMKVGSDTMPAGVEVYNKSCAIVNDLLAEYDSVKTAPVNIAAAPQ